MLLVEGLRSQKTRGTVGSGQIVVSPTMFDRLLCLPQVTEPVLIQALLPKLAIEAFDVGVPGRPFFYWSVKFA